MEKNWICHIKDTGSELSRHWMSVKLLGVPQFESWSLSWKTSGHIKQIAFETENHKAQIWRISEFIWPFIIHHPMLRFENSHQIFFLKYFWKKYARLRLYIRYAAEAQCRSRKTILNGHIRATGSCSRFHFWLTNKGFSVYNLKKKKTNNYRS